MTSEVLPTKSRILAAAEQEFAQYGYAGARVDRIAAAASANKERLYAHFGDKHALFVAVLAEDFTEVLTAIPFDAYDLPGFVGRIFDYAAEHPAHFRMLDWARLEDAIVLVPEVLEGRRAIDIALIREAQEAGVIDPDWDPNDVLTLVFSTATAWVAMGAAFAEETEGDAQVQRERHRAAAVRAVAKIISV